MHGKFWGIVVLVLSSLVGCASKEVPPERTYVRLLASTDGNGSGVVIAPGLILTAKHVAVFANNLYLEPEHIPVKLLRESKDHDIALLEVKGVQCPCAPISSDLRDRLDELVTVVGYPLHGAVKLQVRTQGHVQGIRLGELVLTAPVTFGNSGGGVFDLDGKLIGILTGVAQQPFLIGIMEAASPANYLSSAVNLEAIIKFLGTTIEDYRQ